MAFPEPTPAQLRLGWSPVGDATHPLAAPDLRMGGPEILIVLGEVSVLSRPKLREFPAIVGTVSSTITRYVMISVSPLIPMDCRRS